MGRFPEPEFTSPDNLAKRILAGAIVDLLVKAPNEPLIDILRERAETIASEFDQAIVNLDNFSDVEPAEAKTVRERLHYLRGEFLTLHKRHIDAINAAKPRDAHEISERNLRTFRRSNRGYQLTNWTNW